MNDWVIEDLQSTLEKNESFEVKIWMSILGWIYESLKIQSYVQ